MRERVIDQRLKGENYAPAPAEALRCNKNLGTRVRMGERVKVDV